MKIRSNIICIILSVAIFAGHCAFSQQSRSVIMFDASKSYQAIDNFAASDAWAGQFVGNWPDEKRNAIADLLFSTDTLADGNPKGIGLSMWRYNIGAGSANQGAASEIKDDWRRAASFTNDSNDAIARINAQNWFLSAAKKRGVNQFLGFFNSPPVHLTTNRKAFANKGRSNIENSRYKNFADYAVKAINQIKAGTGITLDYISPVNEPQWDWSDGNQEGCPYSNAEISRLVKIFNQKLIEAKVTTKIIVPEAGGIKYLLKNSDKPGKDNQVHTFFNPASPAYVGSLPTVKRAIAAHSYFSTSPYKDAIALRKQIKETVSKIQGLEFWQTEYCILGDNAGEIDGNKKDLGIDAALYVAKAVYQDLVWANATAWQWWLAVSPYDYKDGLVYIDKNKTDGNYYESKILWALGNYSFFVRPGMKRIEASTTAKDLFVSAFKDSNNKAVIIIVNTSAEKKPISFKNKMVLKDDKVVFTYTTDASQNLKKNMVALNQLSIPAKSVMSVIVD